MDCPMNWFEKKRNFTADLRGNWCVYKIRIRANAKERLPVMVGLTQREATKQQARLMVKRETGATYEIEQLEF